MAEDYISRRFTGGSPGFNEMQGGQTNASPYTGGLPGGNGLMPIDASLQSMNPGLYQFLMRVRDPMYQNTQANENRLGPAGWNAWNPYGGAGAISSDNWAAGQRPENMGMTGAAQPGQPGSWMNAVPNGGQQQGGGAVGGNLDGSAFGNAGGGGQQFGAPPPPTAFGFGGNTPNFGGGFSWNPNQTQQGYSQY